MKTMKNLRDDSPCSDQDINQAPTEYKSKALPLGHSVQYLSIISLCLYKRVDDTDIKPVN
jgi:hypothetical protein